MSLRTPSPAPALSRLQQQHRRRELASDARAGSWSRGKARRRWLFFVRRRWPLLTGMASSAAMPVALVTWLAPNSFLRGAAVGAGVVAVAALSMTLVVQATGTSFMSAGASAEQLTASELRPLVKQGWRLINHLSLKTGDTDHVLIGPGGVVAVETKWASTPWRVSPPSDRVVRAVEQVQNNAHTLRWWHPVKSAGITRVWSAVFLWSAYDPDAPEPAGQPVACDRSQLVQGRVSAASWRDSLANAPAILTPTQIDRLCSQVDAQLRDRDENDAELAPVPATLARAYQVAFGSIIAFVAGSLISTYALTLTGSWLIWGVVSALEVAVGFWSKRLPFPRVVRTSWLAGLALVLIAAVVGLVM